MGLFDIFNYLKGGTLL